MSPVINSRADLDALAGTPAFITAITMINGSRSVSSTILENFGFASDQEWDAYLQAAGHPLTKPAPAVAAVKPIEDLRFDAKQKLAARRFEVETSGIELSGTPIATDRQSQAMLLAALVQLGADEAVQWKGPDGVFRETTRDQLAAVARAVKGHVQSCFAREAALAELIDLAESAHDIEELEAEIKAFWA